LFRSGEHLLEKCRRAILQCLAVVAHPGNEFEAGADAGLAVERLGLRPPGYGRVAEQVIHFGCHGLFPTVLVAQRIIVVGRTQVDELGHLGKRRRIERPAGEQLQVANARRIRQWRAAHGIDRCDRPAARRTDGCRAHAFGVQRSEAVGEHAAGRKSLDQHARRNRPTFGRQVRAGVVDHRDQLQVQPRQCRVSRGERVPVEGVGIHPPGTGRARKNGNQQGRAQLVRDALALEAGPPGIATLHGDVVRGRAGIVRLHQQRGLPVGVATWRVRQVEVVAGAEAGRRIGGDVAHACQVGPEQDRRRAQ
jgi:hypothetical protein